VYVELLVQEMSYPESFSLYIYIGIYIQVYTYINIRISTYIYVYTHTQVLKKGKAEAANADDMQELLVQEMSYLESLCVKTDIK